MSDTLDAFIKDAISEHDTDSSCRQRAEARDSDGWPGHAVGDVLGRGGMGVVYRARQAALEREVAVKVMTLHADEREMAERFHREALVLGRLEHPNIVPIHELGVDAEGRPFYTMKLVKGRTLQAILRALREGDAATAREHTLASLLTVFRKVCDAMAFAHSQGVLHRDLKPENVMVGEFGEVLVMDWGLAKMLKAEGDEWKSENEGNAANLSTPRSPLSALDTLQGSVMGTPQFMSPEQARGEIDALDERADVYSLGAILYAVLALRPPVEGSTLGEVLEKVSNGKVEPLGSTRLIPPAPTQQATNRCASLATVERFPREKVIPLRSVSSPPPSGVLRQPAIPIPESLAAVVRKAMAFDRGDRYASVADLQADITAYEAGFATRAENAGAWKQLRLLIRRHKAVVTTSAAAALALAAFGVWFIVNLRASERVARASEALAKGNEQRALAQEEQTRRTLAQSQVAVAEAAFRSGNRTAMIHALESVPLDLREQGWSYLTAKRDSSLGRFTSVPLPEPSDLAAVPGEPTQFAVATAGGNVRIVDVAAGKLVREVSSGIAGEVVFAISPDGAQIAVTARGAAEIRIFRTSDGASVQTVKAPSGKIDRLVFSPDGKLLTTAEPPQSGNRGLLCLVELASGTIRWQRSHGYTGVLFSRDGTQLFVGSSPSFRHFQVLDVATGAVVKDFPAYVYSLAMSLDGRRVAVGLHGGEVAIYDTTAGDDLRLARMHQGGVTDMAWTAGGHLLTLGGEGGVEGSAKGRRLLRLWETTSFGLRGAFFGMKQGGSPPRWVFQPASGYLLTLESPPQLWRLPVDAEAGRIVGNAEQGYSVAFIDDDHVLARRNYDLAPYDVSDPRAPRELPSPVRSGDGICAVHLAAGLVATASRTSAPPFAIKLHDANVALTVRREMALSAWVKRLDFDAAGERIVAALTSNATQVFSTANGQRLLEIPRKFERVVFAGTAGNLVGLISREGDAQDELVVCDSKTGRVVKTLGFRHRVNELVVSPDRRLLAIGGAEQWVRVLDADTLEERHGFRAHDDAITALTFHPRESVIASAANDGAVKVWNYESATLRREFLGIDATPVMLAFSPNGRLLALEAQERVARVWEVGQ